MPNLPQKLFTIQQAADFLGVSTKTLRRWDKSGRLLPQRTAGNQRRYQQNLLDEFKNNPVSPVTSISSVFSSLPDQRYLPFPAKNIKPILLILIVAAGIIGLPLLAYGGLRDYKKIIAPVPDSQMIKPNSKVLSVEATVPDFVFNVNVPANFFDEVTFSKSISVGGITASTLTASTLTASNVIYSLTAGSGISVTTGQKPTISNSGVLSLGGSTGALSLAAGSGISVSGLTITNSGIVSLTAGAGISVSGSTVTNSDTGSAQNIFKTFAVLGQSDIVADSNTDTFTFLAGTGIILTNDTANDKLTITGLDSGWTDDGTVVRLTTATDKVGIGTASPTEMLHVVGGGIISGNLGIGSSLTVDGPVALNGNVGLGSSANDQITFNGRLSTGTVIRPINDLGADLGSAALRFNNIYVANINTSVAQSYVGQVTFTYEPADTTYTESSILINPTAPTANGSLIGVGIAGYERARIDAEGDIILGYNGNISADVADYPLSVYNHGTSLVAYVDTAGNAYFAGNVTGPEGGTIGYWQRNSNAISPKTVTDDILTGATAPASALIKFTGTPGGNSWINTGNFGIGTTSPAYKVDILGNMNVAGTASIGTLSVGNTSPVALFSVGSSSQFQVNSSGYALLPDGLVSTPSLSFTENPNTGLYRITTNKMAFVTGGVERLTLDANGNIGIGTTNPSYKFHLTGTAGDYLSYIYNIGTGSTASGLYIRSDGEGNLLNLNYAGSDIFTVNQAQTTINNPTNFTSSGDVSIAYDIVFSNLTASYIKSLAPLTIQAGRDYNSDDLTLKAFNTGNIIMESANLWADGTNLGIGTTNPAKAFQVNQGVGGTGAFVVTSAGQAGVGTTGVTSGYMLDVFGNVILNNTGSLYVGGTATIAGNVGISGTATINSTLDVNSQLLAANNLPGTINQVLTSTGTGVSWGTITLGDLGGISGSGTANYLTKWSTPDSTIINSQLFDDGTNLGIGTSTLGTAKFSVMGGNVGIGTTNPTQQLDVTGNINVGATGYIGTLAVGATNPITPLIIGGLTSTAGTALVVDASGNVYKTDSSRRVKDNIQDYTDDFNKIMQLQPKSFTYKATGAPDIGFIAEDLDELGLSNLVIYDNEGLPTAIKYDRISLYLLEVMKQQQEQIARLDSQTASSEARLASLSAEIRSQLVLSGIEGSVEINIQETDTLTASQSAILDNLIVTDLGVTGKITTGLLVIDGLTSSGSSISTLSGPLELQKNSLGNLEIMDGKVVIDTKGNLSIQGSITAKKYNVDESDTLSASAGEGIILAEEINTIIYTTAVTGKSRIFITPKGLAVPIAVSAQTEGGFEVIIDKKLEEDLRFSWWIIN